MTFPQIRCSTQNSYTNLGTEFEKGDVEADLQGIVNNQKTPQINSACTFALNFREIVEKIVTLSIDTDPVHLILTGHSLGGWLAQIATFALKYVEFSHCATQFKRVKDDRCHAHCVVFDSPGAQLILNYINSLPEIRKNHDLHTISLDICNYVIYPNLVNVINPPFGDMVQISSEQICASLKPLKSLAFSTIGHTRRFHSIDVFIQILNPGNQFPRSVTSLLKQPVHIVKNWLSALLIGDSVAKFDRSLNSDVSYLRVVNWPMVVFSGWNTKLDKALGRRRKILIKGLSSLRDSNARRELIEWVSSAEKYCKTVPLQNGQLSLSMTRFSEIEKRIIEQFERIRLWKEYI